MRRFWGSQIFVLLVCLVQTTSAQDAALVVVPDDLPTVEVAYARVKAGGSIALKQGKYALSRTLEIDKTVTFRGDAQAPEEVVIVCPHSDAFHITGGSPSFENLTVSGGAKEGVGFFIEGKDAAPTLEKCVIKDCGGAGVVVMDEARGTFRDCDIYGNLSGIEVVTSGNPTVTRCRIHDCQYIGVFVDEARGEFRDCDIYADRLGEIRIERCGDPTFIGCKIHDGKHSGVNVFLSGRGTFQDCEIYGNGHSGITVWATGNPTVTGCRIHDGKGAGIRIFVKGMGTFNNNTLSENYVDGKLSNWIIEGDAEMVKGTGNTPEIPRAKLTLPDHLNDER